MQRTSVNMSKACLQDNQRMMSIRATKALLIASVDWVEKCKPWLDEEGALYQQQGVSNPPIKDFYMIWVDVYQIVFTFWEIRSPFQKTQGTMKGAFSVEASYQAFKTDGNMRGMIECRVGESELIFLDELMKGNINFLDRMPDGVLLHIIKFLDLRSVLNLARTSKNFKTLCYDNDVWHRLYNSSDLKFYMTQGLLEMVQAQGWRLTYTMAYRVRKSVLSWSGGAGNRASAIFGPQRNRGSGSWGQGGRNS